MKKLLTGLLMLIMALSLCACAKPAEPAAIDLESAGWDAIVEAAKGSTVTFYGWGEIMNPSVYGKVRRCGSDIIYCSVTFEEGYKSYYYIADDDSIEVGDFVIVPAGKDNHEAVVEVVKKEYFAEDEVPLPAEKTKHIIRKCTDDDFDLPEE